jgi:hypothetical protein
MNSRKGMNLRKVATSIVVVAAVAAFSAMAVSAATRSVTVRCAELPASLRSACAGPGVTCKVKPDDHGHWEAVYATEPTMAKAQKMLELAKARGFHDLDIETDVQCSNGAGVYEVGKASFTSHAQAAALVASAKAAGFPNARTEDS